MRCAIDHSLSQSKFIRELIMNNYNLLYVLAPRLHEQSDACASADSPHRVAKRKAADNPLVVEPIGKDRNKHSYYRLDGLLVLFEFKRL